MPGFWPTCAASSIELLKAKVSQGYVPTWKDFVRCCDLITLCRWRKDDALALEVARLLVEQAPKAGWTCDCYLTGCSGVPAKPPGRRRRSSARIDGVSCALTIGGCGRSRGRRNTDTPAARALEIPERLVAVDRAGGRKRRGGCCKGRPAVSTMVKTSLSPSTRGPRCCGSGRGCRGPATGWGPCRGGPVVGDGVGADPAGAACRARRGPGRGRRSGRW